MSLTFDQVKKYRTDTTAIVILEHLERVDVTELITELFIHSDNEVSMVLIKKFESILVLAVTSPEKFKDDRIFLLFKLYDQKGESTMGFFDTKIQLFYLIFKESSGEHFNEIMKNFILENYLHLTTDIEIDRKRNFALRVVNDIESNDLLLYEGQPAVQFVFDKKGEKGERKRKERENTVFIPKTNIEKRMC